MGGGNEAAVSPGRPGVPSEGATGLKLGDRLPGPIRRVVLWPSASLQRSEELVVSAGVRMRGTDRMEY